MKPIRASVANEMARPLSSALCIALALMLCFSVCTVSAGDWARRVFEAGVFLLLGVWAAWAVGRGYAVRLAWVIAPPLAMAIIALVQLIRHSTADRYMTLAAGVHWLALAAWTLLALQVFRFQRLRQLFLHGLVYSATVLGVVSVLQVLTSDGRVFWLVPSGYADDVLGPFVNRNHFAAFLVIVLPVALHYALKLPRESWRFAPAAAMLFACVTASASRAGFLLAVGLSAGFLLHGCIRAPSRRMVPRLLALLVLCTGVVGLKVWDRLRAPAPEVDRDQFLLSSVEMFRARPWSGFGLGTWAAVYPAYARFDPGPVVNHAHNDWAEWAAEGGAPALLAMVILLGLAVRASLSGVWIVGVIAVFLHSLVDYPLQKPALEALVFLLIAAGAAERRAAREAVSAVSRSLDYSFPAAGREAGANASSVSRVTSNS